MKRWRKEYWPLAATLAVPLFAALAVGAQASVNNGKTPLDFAHVLGTLAIAYAGFHLSHNNLKIQRRKEIQDSISRKQEILNEYHSAALDIHRAAAWSFSTQEKVKNLTEATQLLAKATLKTRIAFSTETCFLAATKTRAAQQSLIAIRPGKEEYEPQDFDECFTAMVKEITAEINQLKALQ